MVVRPKHMLPSGIKLYICLLNTAPAASQNQGPVEADKLAKELEAIKSNPETLTPTPPSRPASGASGRSSRSRAKKKRERVFIQSKIPV